MRGRRSRRVGSCWPQSSCRWQRLRPVRGQEPAATGGSGYATTLASPADLATRFDRILADPALTRADVGLVIQVAETGEVLYELDGEKLFVPASNTKIVTAAVALDALGPAYRWETSFAADGAVVDGVLEGDLWIVGGGDPRLSREAVAAWPQLLERAGIRRITGDVIGDDRAFSGPAVGRGLVLARDLRRLGGGCVGAAAEPEHGAGPARFGSRGRRSGALRDA